MRHGDSGGPAVDADGYVQAMIFAARIGSPSGYGVPIALVVARVAQVGSGRRSRPATARRLKHRQEARPRSAAAGTAPRRRRPTRARARPRSARARARRRPRAPPEPARRYRSCTCSGTTIPGASLCMRTSSLDRADRPHADEHRDRPRRRSARGTPRAASRSKRICVIAKRAPAATLRWKRSASRLEVVGGRVHGDAREERRRRVDRAAVEVLARGSASRSARRARSSRRRTRRACRDSRPPRAGRP